MLYGTLIYYRKCSTREISNLLISIERLRSMVQESISSASHGWLQKKWCEIWWQRERERKTRNSLNSKQHVIEVNRPHDLQASFVSFMVGIRVWPSLVISNLRLCIKCNFSAHTFRPLTQMHSHTHLEAKKISRLPDTQHVNNMTFTRIISLSFDWDSSKDKYKKGISYLRKKSIENTW